MYIRAHMYMDVTAVRDIKTPSNSSRAGRVGGWVHEGKRPIHTKGRNGIKGPKGKQLSSMWAR